MNYITINEEYLSYLRKYENRIPYQDYGEYKYKPFIGPLFELNGLVYVTHLTHYDNEKHSNIDENNKIKHVIKDLKGNPVSIINLAGMFPVPPEAFKNLRYDELENTRLFRDEREKYKFEKFLKIQMKYIQTLNIHDHAKNLYARQKVFNDYRFCVEYSSLEKLAKRWQQENQVMMIIQMKQQKIK